MTTNKTDYPGRRKCVVLKDIRRKIAEANGIPFATEDCDYEGPCWGTCPKCDSEIQYLHEKLQEKEARGEEVILQGIGIDDIDTYEAVTESTVPTEEVAIIGWSDYEDSFMRSGDDQDCFIMGEPNMKRFSDPRERMIYDLGLSPRTYHCLKAAGLRTVGDICALTGDQLMQVCNQRKKSCKEILHILRKHGLALKSLPDT